MSTSVCRLCYSLNTKLTSSIDSEIVANFIEFIPSLDISSNSKFPSAVCQLCYGKAKITCDFIKQIEEAQRKIEKCFKGSPRKLAGSQFNATEDALKKVQQVSGIKVTKVVAKSTEYFDNCEVIEELDLFANNDSEDDFPPASDVEETIEGEDDYEQLLDEDEYKPKKSVRGSSDENKAAVKPSTSKKIKEETSESEDEYKPDVDELHDEDEDYKPNKSVARRSGERKAVASGSTVKKEIKDDVSTLLRHSIPLNYTQVLKLH